MTTTLEFQRRPSTLAYMLRAFYPSPGLKGGGNFPALRAAWNGVRIDPGELGEFLALTGLRDGASVPMLYPHVVGFRLLMALLTLPAYPLAIWGALQIRNRLVQHRPIAKTDLLDLESRVAEQRFLDKGVEVDLNTAVRVRGELAWESSVTFFYRGRFGEGGPPSPLARSPEISEEELARWRTDSGVGRRFGRLTGDYNGIHLWRWYARLFGFKRAFHHPQLVLGQCMSRLPPCDPQQPQRLDAWLKGPVFYGSDVVLRGSRGADGVTFGLYPAGELRPAIVGSWAWADAAREQPVPKPEPANIAVSA